MTELQFIITVPAYDVTLVDDEIVILLSLWAVVPNMVLQSTWLMLGRHTPSTPSLCACETASGSCDVTIAG